MISLSLKYKAELFTTSIFAAFLLPTIIPGTGIDYPFVFTVGIILFAWFVLKWQTLSKLTFKPRLVETTAGFALVIADYAENSVSHSNLGLIDMLLIFFALSIAFYGLGSLRFFSIPYMYLVILIIGYQVENKVPELISLQYALAGLMSELMKFVGVHSWINPSQPNIVYLQNILPDGSVNTMGLEVDGPCTGLKGILAFGLLSSMALLDTKPSRKQLVILLVGGFAGAFMINIVRLAVIFLTFEYLGVEAGKVMHIYAGYTLFIAWVVVFWSLAFRYIVAMPSKQVNTSTSSYRTGKM